MFKKKFSSHFLLVGGLFLTACANNEDINQVTLGVVGENNEAWEYVVDELMEKENIPLNLQTFTDYATPNKALADGSIDLNAFQTEIFLDEFNKTADQDLQVIGYTIMAPLGIYSASLSDVEELTDSMTVAIPNDPSNGGRALRLLETADLITLDPQEGLAPTVDDITANPLNLIIEELDSSQTARALEDVDASVINSGMAVDAGFFPSEDAIFLEPVTEESVPYYNVIAAHPDNVDNDTFKTIVAYYQTDTTAAVIKEASKGSQFPIWE